MSKRDGGGMNNKGGSTSSRKSEFSSLPHLALQRKDKLL